METTTDNPTLYNPHAFSVFVHEGEVVEIRVIYLKGRMAGEYHKGTLSGYFDDNSKFCEAVKTLEQCEHTGIYFTLQVIDPRLLARAFNRMKPGILGTSDPNVIAYRWLPIDLGPVRPAGISSSDSELEQAYEMRERVIVWIAENLNFTNPVKAMSGNGYHLLYKLPDLEANEQNKQFIKSILENIDEQFSTSKVSIDTAVFNPARIWKLYGTRTGKGDEVPANQYREARPHRTSYIEDLGVADDNE
ncbi:MAG: hypothetical protein NT178_09370 [Proteobacteria bacterium]|nr:hypothetical protein [Pseudomonadota bacterium]